MAPSQRPAKRTESTCTRETEQGTHAFRVVGYSLQRGIGRGKFIRSANFAVGGYDWAVRFYPDGGNTEVSKGYVSVYLELRSKDTEARALYDFRLLDQHSGMSKSICSSSTVRVFRSGPSDKPSWGIPKFMKRTTLEASKYLRKDCLVIECDVTVIKEVRVVKAATTVEVQVPPPNLLDGLGKLLESDEIADVTFKVKGEIFYAHKLMLAVRSPVFKAKLYGPMRDKESGHINVDDMEPYVFKALLHFIYKDSLPTMEELDGDENEEMVKHILVAADRYGVERMKLICEGILCNRLDVESVAATLALADQYHCSKLKDVCIEFINSSNRLDDVLSSQGYTHLKTHVPLSLWKYLRKRLISPAKSRKIILS
ncbi:unnamed protein product [Urochloa decumbens]|uniref:Uncharacterized protein n=1 Tax=Urochloa decumbens TaxID=240449 RepID=A0ABC9BSX9_9POAL